MPTKRLSRLSSARLLPLLLLLPFLIGLLSTHLFRPFPRTTPAAASSSSSSSSSGVHFLPFNHPPTCQPRLLVETPPSAGLNPLHHALSRLLPGQSVALCHAADGCAPLLRRVCNGSAAPPMAVVGVLRADRGTMDCLRARHGYYATVAAREPLDRWSAEFVREGGQAGGKQYLDWMKVYPDCRLLDYFDGKGTVCADDDDVADRVEKVVERFDEGVDVYAGRGGAVYERVRRLVGEGVKLDRPHKKFRSFLGMSRLRGEGWLYEAVVTLRAREGRRFC